MTDKELLELAAKAAGIEHTGEAYHPIVKNTVTGLYLACDGDAAIWNPLTDDGDALRLSVKLGIEICYPFVLVQELDSVRAGTDTFECFGDDPYAATRRAIVRAAAEIGRTL